MTRAAATIPTAALCIALWMTVAQAADAPRRVVSFNLCADQLVVALADPEQIAGLSPYAADPALSVVAEPARQYRKADWQAESTILLEPDLISRFDVGRRNPVVVREFLRIMDDPASYPVLIHCKAGLHRTGCLVGVYRMEYENWSPSRVVAEMKALGFGDSACTSANDYIAQYVTRYRRRSAEGSGP